MSVEQPQQIEYPDIAKDIEVMFEADQAMRHRALENKGVIESEEDDKLDLKNTETMKKIVEQIGWPTVSRVGEEASQKAWLLVQHADHDIEFQKKCLELMKEVSLGQVSKRNLAYLEDRVLVNSGLPQKYGTQFRGDTEEEFNPKPIKDPEHVDERRKEVGMEPIAEYREVMINKFFRRNK